MSPLQLYNCPSIFFSSFNALCRSIGGKKRRLVSSLKIHVVQYGPSSVNKITPPLFSLQHQKDLNKNRLLSNRSCVFFFHSRKPQLAKRPTTNCVKIPKENIYQIYGVHHENRMNKFSRHSIMYLAHSLTLSLMFIAQNDAGA